MCSRKADRTVKLREVDEKNSEVWKVKLERECKTRSPDPVSVFMCLVFIPTEMSKYSLYGFKMTKRLEELDPGGSNGNVKKD